MIVWLSCRIVQYKSDAVLKTLYEGEKILTVRSIFNILFQVIGEIAGSQEKIASFLLFVDRQTSA